MCFIILIYWLQLDRLILFGIPEVIWKKTVGSIDRCIAKFYLNGLSKLSNQKILTIWFQIQIKLN